MSLTTIMMSLAVAVGLQSDQPVHDSAKAHSVMVRANAPTSVATAESDERRGGFRHRDDFEDFTLDPVGEGDGERQPEPTSIRDAICSAKVSPTVEPPVEEVVADDLEDDASETVAVVAPTQNVVPPTTKSSWPGEIIEVIAGTSVTLELDRPIDAAEVTDAGIADLIVATPARLLLVGKAIGETQLRLRTGRDISVHQINVEPNTATLQKIILATAPTSDVRIDTIRGQLVLMGRVSDAQDVTKIEQLARAYQGGEVINHLSVAGVQQTMIRVVVAEVNRDASRQLGVNWGFGGSDLSRDFFFANNVNQINPTVFGSNGLADVTTGQLTYAVNPTALGPNSNFTLGFPRAELQWFLNALRENSLGRTLAEPNLVAISGQTATFLAGGEVPIPVTQGGAVAGAITLEYREFGIRLSFTPTVLGGQVMRLHVMSEVSDAVPAGQLQGVPSFSFETRRVETTIECGNGQTFAIAGLLDDSIRAVSSKIPGLGDIPVLGTLFSSVDYQRSRTELVILVTPELVSPMDPQMVPPVPGADIHEPTDEELFFLQKLEGSKPKTNKAKSAAAPEPELESTEESVLAGNGATHDPWQMTLVENNYDGTAVSVGDK